MSHVSIALLALQLVATPYSESAATIEASRPARPAANARLDDLIEFPAGEGELSLTIFCAGVVTKYGRLSSNWCFHENDAYRRAIARAAVRARFEPAFLNGRPVGVWYQFSIVFQRHREATAVALLPHHGPYDIRFRTNYSAPQAVLSPSLPRIRGCKSPPPSGIESLITANGERREIRILGDLSARCRSSIMRWAKKRRFVPAFHNGEPVAAMHKRALFYLRPGN